MVLATCLRVQWAPRIMMVRAGLCEDENNYGLEVDRPGRIIGWLEPAFGGEREGSK